MKRVLVVLILAMSAVFAKAQNNGGVTCTWPIPGANIVVCCGPCACVVCANFTDPTAPGTCIDMVLQCSNQTSIQRPLTFVGRLEMPLVDPPELYKGN